MSQFVPVSVWSHTHTMNLNVYAKVILTLQDLTRIVLTHSDNRQRQAPSHQVKNEIAGEETVALFKLQTIFCSNSCQDALICKNKTYTTLLWQQAVGSCSIIFRNYSNAISLTAHVRWKHKSFILLSWAHLPYIMPPAILTAWTGHLQQKHLNKWDQPID